jgi:hypothetical protein
MSLDLSSNNLTPVGCNKLFANLKVNFKIIKILKENSRIVKLNLSSLPLKSINRV